MPIHAGTELYAVIGSPIRHSMSPLMHNTAFAATGIDAVYVAFEVQDIVAAIAGLRALGIRGASVTIPHKVSIMAELDVVDDDARAIGAVNTVVNRRGRLQGANTDVSGAVRAVEDRTLISKKRVAVLGAGGAARAIAYGMAARGGKICIFNRTAEKGDQLARMVGGEAMPPAALKDFQPEILINTTPVGMAPQLGKCPVGKTTLKTGMVVMDAVYNPSETELIRRARAAGCQVISGLLMFIYQGVEQFEIWTGREAPVADMERVVSRQLAMKTG